MKHILFVIFISLFVACKTSQVKMYKPWTALKKEVVMQNDNLLNQFRKIAQKRWGNSVGIMQQIKSEALEQVLKNKQFFYVGFKYVNPSGFIPNYLTIVADKDTTRFIETDNDALTYISRQKISVKTSDQAFLMVNAFADFRNYILLNSSNELNKDAKDYSQQVCELNGSWTISIALNVNLVAYKIVRYKFKITKSGIISILANELICAHPGGR
jgi:hypothetical protein